MKKIFVMLVAFIGFGISVYAQERFQVTLETYLTLTWEDPTNGVVLKTENKNNVNVTREVCADSEDSACSQASTKWISEADYKTYVREETINGKKYKVYSYRNVREASAKRLGQSCR
jgi:hypothetical protein